MKQAKLVIILTILLIPLNLQALNDSEMVKVFDFEGNLVNIIQLQGLDWQKIGDIAVADLGVDGVPEIIISSAFGEKPYIKIYRLDGSLINQFMIYPEAY